MRANLSQQEWELLSAYLDGQLSEQEKRVLEGRMLSQPELRNELEALRRTQAVLRNVPRLRVPRNFTLSPKDLPSRPKSAFRLFPVLGFSSALALCLAAVTFVFQMVPRISNMQLAQAPAAEVLPAAADAFGATPTVQIITWGESQAAPMKVEGGSGGGGGGAPGLGGIGGGPPPSQSVPPAATPVNNLPQPTGILPAATQQAEIAPAAPMTAPPGKPTTGALTEPTVIPQEVQPDSAIPATEVAKAIPSPGGEGPILGIAPPEEQGKIMVPTRSDAIETAPTEAANAAPSRVAVESPLWWLLPAGLAVVALVLGLTAVIIWLITHR